MESSTFYQRRLLRISTQIRNSDGSKQSSHPAYDHVKPQEIHILFFRSPGFDFFPVGVHQHWGSGCCSSPRRFGDDGLSASRLLHLSLSSISNQQ